VFEVTATFRVLLTVEVKPGRAADFEQEWRSGDHEVAGQPANRGHWLARSDAQENTYYVVSDWTDEPSFRAFENSEAHLAHRVTMRPYLANGAMATMTLVGGADRALTEVTS
jgi:heme-degrading monooxygenase HmoA